MATLEKHLEKDVALMQKIYVNCQRRVCHNIDLVLNVQLRVKWQSYAK